MRAIKAVQEGVSPQSRGRTESRKTNAHPLGHGRGLARSAKGAGWKTYVGPVILFPAQASQTNPAEQAQPVVIMVIGLLPATRKHYFGDLVHF
jgi:hypothetical protein